MPVNIAVALNLVLAFLVGARLNVVVGAVGAFLALTTWVAARQQMLSTRVSLFALMCELGVGNILLYVFLRG